MPPTEARKSSAHRKIGETNQPPRRVRTSTENAKENTAAQSAIERRIRELEAIALASQAISEVRDLDTLYSILHKQLHKTMGNIDFVIALYEPTTDAIRIPYMYEKSARDGKSVSLKSFPLGDDLISILLRTKQPLMIVENIEKRMTALGVKAAGKPSKSWLGVPLMVGGEAIGALIIQDTEHEHAFDEYHLHFISTLSSQVAGAIHNIHLVDDSRRRALQLQTAAEIARDISGSIDLTELLIKAVNLIHDRFNFYHAAIFLIDPSGENVVIREGTGEAGVQMKRAGLKLNVGSKSIAGYVAGNGVPLIVNDTSTDATFYANPLLPETRAEAALPLKVGQRILGVLDIQSTVPYSFASEDISVLGILADQLAAAVLNSELFAETQEHLSQHRLLHHVITAAASGTTLEESLNGAAQGLQVTLGGDHVAIMLADKAKKTLVVKAVVGYSEEVKQMEIPFEKGITGWVATHQQPLRISDVTKDKRHIPISEDIHSELAIPLLYRGELLGVIDVGSDQIGAYSENDEEMLGSLGGSLAAIIANAGLVEQVRHQVDRERLLYVITGKIRRSTDIQTIMATTASELSRAFGVRHARIRIEPQVTDETTPEINA